MAEAAGLHRIQLPSPPRPLPAPRSMPLSSRHWVSLSALGLRRASVPATIPSIALQGDSTCTQPRLRSSLWLLP